MTRSHEAVVDAQFGAQAAAYVQSSVHAAGEDLDAVEALAAGQHPAVAVDLGAGGGHVVYGLARHAGRVIAIDLSEAMLAAVRDEAQRRDLTNIETCAAPAEHIPLDDASCDMLACRFSAHHWRDWRAGLREARRILKPGATAIFIDVISPGYAPFDTHLQAIELLRDPSHVRDYSEGEWSAALAEVGFRVRGTQKRRLRMEFASWVGRMRSPEPHQVAIRSLQDSASRETRTYYAIEEDGSFSIDTLQIEAIACRAREL